MSKIDEIKKIAQQKLEESGLFELFSNTPLGKPYLGKAIENDGYFGPGTVEIPVLFNYNGREIRTGSFFASLNCKDYYFPDNKMVQSILRDNLEGILKKEKEEEMHRAIDSYLDFKTEVWNSLRFENHGDYDRFRKNVQESKAPEELVEAFIKVMARYLPNVDTKILSSLDPESLMLDIFPYILINYSLEGKITDQELDKSIDYFISISKASEDTWKLVQERERREIEGDSPLAIEPLIVKTKGQDGQEKLDFLDCIVKSNEDLVQRQLAIDEAIDRNKLEIRRIAQNIENS